MKNLYEPGAVRWKRWHCKGDVRLHRPAKGWVCYARLLDERPITNRPFAESQWWLREQYYGDQA